MAKINLLLFHTDFDTITQWWENKISNLFLLQTEMDRQAEQIRKILFLTYHSLSRLYQREKRHNFAFTEKSTTMYIK